MKYSIIASRRIFYRALYALFFTSCLVLTSSCSKDDSPTGANDTQITADFYIQATLNGSVVTLQHGVSSYGHGVGGSFGGGSGPGYAVTVQSFLQRATYQGGELVRDPKNSMTISFTKNFDSYPSEQEYHTVIPIGEVPYGSEEMNIEGAEIIWIDANGTQWTSWPTESGNSFVVTSHKEVTYAAGGSRMGLYTTKGEFFCTLHDNAGHTMNLENGTFVMRTMPLH